MKKQDDKAPITLDVILSNPALEDDYREVFSFVEAITASGFNPHDIPPDSMERWNKRFEEVLGQLIVKSSTEDKDAMKEGKHGEK